MSEWQTMGDLAVPKGLIGGPFGSNLVNRDYQDHGVPVIRGSNMGERFLKGRFAFVSQGKYEEDLTRNTAQPGDLIFTQRGTLGQVSLVPRGAWNEYVISQSQMRLRVNESKVNPYWVYYYCTTSEFIRQVDNNAISVGVPHINLGILSKLQVPRILRRRQDAIAEVLRALDDKIAANKRAVKIAAEHSSAVYQSFAVRSNTRIDLRELVVTQYGVTVSADDSSNTKLLRVTDINKRPWIAWDEVPTCQVSSSEKEKYRLFPGDVVVARMADPGKAAYIDDSSPESVFASYLVRLKPRDTELSLYLYYFLCSPEYQAYVDQNATGSVQRHLNAKKIVDTSIPVIGGSDLGQFNEQVSQIRSQLGSLNSQNGLLARTRDELLPLLMSGKITVKDAEKVVSDAV